MDGSIIVVDGYGADVRVERGHLRIRNGRFGSADDQLLRVSRGRAEVNRLVILSHDGCITLDAIDWCARMGITLAFIASDSTLTNCLIADRSHDGPLKRAQANCAISDEALPMARTLLQAKITSQAQAINRDFPSLQISSNEARKKASQKLQSAINGLEHDVTLRDLLIREGYAAKVYWELLNGTPLPWRPWALKRIPAHWAFIGARFSGGRNGVRDARDPFNAVLNYVYTLLEVETRIACAAVGLDPDLGLLHVDDRLRESFVCDLLEPLRAMTDVLTLQLLRKYGLHPAMFHELRDGVVRLDPNVTKLFATSLMPHLSRAALNGANHHATRLRRIAVPYRLVGGRSVRSTTAIGNSICGYCKEPLPKRGLKFCSRHCYLKYSVEVAKPILIAQAKLAEMRLIGLSPGHGGEAAKKRGTAIAQSNQRRALGLTSEQMRARRAEQQRQYRRRRKDRGVC